MRSRYIGRGTLRAVEGGAETEVDYDLCFATSRPETSVVQQVLRGSISFRNEESRLEGGLYRLSFEDEWVTVRLFNGDKVTGISGM